MCSLRAFQLLMLWTAPALRHRSAIDWSRQSQSDSKEVRPGNDDGVPKFWRNWRGHDDVMQTRSIRGSGEPVWVNASSNACFRLGPDPRRALWPAASPPHKQAGHMTAPDQCCKNVRKFLPRRRRPHMTRTGHWRRMTKKGTRVYAVAPRCPDRKGSRRASRTVSRNSTTDKQ